MKTPGTSKVCTNWSPALRRSAETKEVSSAVTVWRPAVTVHVTVVPTGTVSSLGSKRKFLTSTATGSGASGEAGMAGGGVAPTSAGVRYITAYVPTPRMMTAHQSEMVERIQAL